MIGQLVSAQAALKLLQARAEVGRDSVGTTPWPEFSEYACSACHKDLQVRSPRQLAGYGRRQPGSLPWGAWHLTMIQTLARQTRRPELRGVGEDNGSIALLRSLMERPGGDRREIAREAGSLAALLGDWLDRDVSRTPLKAADVRLSLAGLLDDMARRADLLSWDEATQAYLAVAALHQGLQDLVPPPAKPANLLPGIIELRRRLEEAFPPGSDTPSRFNPLAEPRLSLQLQNLRKQLGD